MRISFFEKLIEFYLNLILLCNAHSIKKSKMNPFISFMMLNCNNIYALSLMETNAIKQSQLSLWRVKNGKDFTRMVRDDVFKIMGYLCGKLGKELCFARSERSEERRVGKECRSRWAT